MGAGADGDRGADRIRRRVDNGYSARDEVRDIDLAAVGFDRHTLGVGADGDRGADRIRRRVDHRYGVRVEVGNVDLAAVGAHRHAEWEEGDVDGGADRVHRRVDHRYGVRVEVGNVGVLAACRRRSEQGGERQSESELFHVVTFTARVGRNPNWFHDILTWRKDGSLAR